MLRARSLVWFGIFTNFVSPFCSPFKWNHEKRALEITKSRWKLIYCFIVRWHFPVLALYEMSSIVKNFMSDNVNYMDFTLMMVWISGSLYGGVSAQNIHKKGPQIIAFLSQCIRVESDLLKS